MSDSKPIKYAVAIILRNEKGKFLTTRRSDDDASLPGVWGLPAVSLAENETEHDAVVRVGRVKLGVEVKPKVKVGTGTIERKTFTLVLTDYEVDLISGVPSVPQSDISLSQYVDLKFTDDLSLLVPAAVAGSLCSRVFLDKYAFEWREV